MLFICHDPGLQGAQKSLLDLLLGLDKTLIESYVVAPALGPFVYELQKAGVTTFVQPLTRWVVYNHALGRRRRYRYAIFGVRPRVAGLMSLIRQYGIAAVYTNTICCIDGALAARRAKIPHVWHVREHISKNPALCPLLPPWLSTRLVGALSKHVITNSKRVRFSYDDALPPHCLSVVYNGIDVNKFSPPSIDRATMRRKLNLPDSSKLVVLAGSIVPGKGHSVFVDAAAHVSSGRADVTFLIVGWGSGEIMGMLQSRIATAGLTDKFLFLGWREDMHDILKASDLLVVASEREAFGRTVIEAMATGLPVVATRSGGPEEIVVEGETGLLVPVNDPRAMANAISSIIRDEALAQRMGAAGRERVVSTFSLTAYVDRVEQILAEVVCGPSGAEAYRTDGLGASSASST